MFQPMKGVKVLEVAQYTFTPAAGAILADWGAEVVKVEHAVHGDAQRGLTTGHGGATAGSFHPLMEHSNRGKRSIGLALETPGGRSVLMELARDADVFLTNFLPSARRRLRLEVEDLRAVNPQVIYVRGSGNGQRGPDAERGGYDGSTFWARMGSAWGTTPPDSPRVITQPSAAYGDSIGGAILAGGIAAALFGRTSTGEPSVVDVSLMSVGTWALGVAIGTSRLKGEPTVPAALSDPPHLAVNPLIGDFRTSDGRWINFTMIQPGRCFADVCRHLGLEHLLDDKRFATAEGVMRHAGEIGAAVARAISAKPYPYWVDHLQTMESPWAPVQDPLEVAADPQVDANGYLRPFEDAEGNLRHVVANPVQFDETPPTITRGPLFAEHTDEILRELGKSDEEIIELKIEGACT